jgi:dachs protein
VVRTLPTEKNYHIFYQMMAGLTSEERKQLGLDRHTVMELRYLNRGDTRSDETQEIERFNTWKANLVVLGIPFMDVVKVMAAILLLGNVEFVEGNGLEVDMIGKEELKSVSKLIGVTPALLLQGLTSKTHNVRGHLVKSSSDANMVRFNFATSKNMWTNEYFNFIPMQPEMP